MQHYFAENSDSWRAKPKFEVCQERLGLGVVLGLELQALGVEARQVRQDAGLRHYDRNSWRQFTLAGDCS